MICFFYQKSSVLHKKLCNYWLVGCETSYRRKPVSLRYRLRVIHNSDPASNYPGGCYPPPLLWKRRGWNRDKADRAPDFHRGDDLLTINH